MRLPQSYLYHKLMFPFRRFRFNGTTLRYFHHRYNLAYRNERTIEIPIIQSFIAGHQGKILEVGNVLSHYVPTKHEILDKYERQPGVINEDIVEYNPAHPYSLIISISTLEHIGWDEDPEQTVRIYHKNETPETVIPNPRPEKIVETVTRLADMLVTGGKLICTFPSGYNPHLDTLIEQKAISYTRLWCMRRISWSNAWIENSWPQVKSLKYNAPFPCANGLAVALVEKP